MRHSLSCVALKPPVLCLVTDRTACLGRPLGAVVAAAVGGGVRLVQLRDRDLPARELLRLGQALLAPVRAGGAALVVNDRVDVALALGADGVHLGAGSLPLAEARRVVGAGLLIGVSVHSLKEAILAESQGADYLVLGTIFETRSHPGKPAAGVSLVAEVTATVRLPVLAIGGITPANAASVMVRGAAGVAVIGAIQSAEDVQAATRALMGAISPR